MAHKPTYTKCVSEDLGVRITQVEGLCGGRPTIRGMRIRVSDILDMLAGGATPEEILADFPYLEPADLRACYWFGARRANIPRIAA